MSSLNSRQLVVSVVLIGFAAITVMTSQNCSKVDFGASDFLVETSTADDLIPESKALVYGGDAEDQRLLAAKLAGYRAPALNEILNNWRRISGSTLYNSVNEIVVADQDNSFCATTLDPTTGEWAATIDPSGAKLAPGSSGQCIDLPWFAAMSWSYLPTNRLHHATNSGNFNGFISTLKFDQYKHQTTVTSAGTDDDAIAVIIASTIDGAGVVHTLSAVRSHGGAISGGKNWFVAYLIGNKVAKVIGAQVFDVLNINGGTTGDAKGWNGRKSLISVERNGDSISAKTSLWQTDDSKLAIDPTSEIKVDLSDSSLGLQIFRGEQSYGYGILSQQGSEFYDTSFAAVHDDRYVYDLATDRVFEQQLNGSYALLPGASAYAMLKPPIRVGNIETQRKYRLYTNRTYKQVFN